MMRRQVAHAATFVSSVCCFPAQGRSLLISFRPSAQFVARVPYQKLEGNMMRYHIAHAVAFVSLICCILPGAASAQSQITGVVTDASGAVLPGVTVEASSPALIENVRTAVTDDQGRYAIPALRPGTYKVTFTLPGFSPFVRDGMALLADFTATVNAELRVGSLEETVTVSGESPTVDVQSTQRTTVLDRELLDAVPTGRTFFAAVARGGAHVNFIPKEGGNTFSSTNYFGYTTGAWQSNNLGDLLSRGLSQP